MDQELINALNELKREMIELKTEVLLVRFGVEQVERMVEELKLKNKDNDHYDIPDQNYNIEKL